ncbi:MAG: family 43 glycosylhydrolase [Bacteroides cellulosilyticus]
MNMITNPILTGFNPDPSICRVGDDFYIATSTLTGFRVYRYITPVTWFTGIY